MIKSKFTLTSLLLLVSMASLIADPMGNANYYAPEPVGGIESLERNTVYPLFEKTDGNEADVVIRFTVDSRGNVSNVSVAQSGGSLFDNSAIMAVENTDWIPAMQNGFRVRVTYELPFKYRTQ